MNKSIQLLSSRKSPEMEKAAILSLLTKGISAARPFIGSAAKATGSRLSDLAARRDFLGGLAAPVTKFVGGLQNVYGRGQQGIAALRQGLGSSADDLLKNPLYQRGAKNISAGKNLREQSAFFSGMKAPNPMGYRAGRLVGGVAVGAPLMNLPFTAAEYAGAASADPELAKNYAKEMAYERAKDRLNQFQSMPFLDRMKAVYNPQAFTQQLEMPEASDLYQAMSSDNTASPGVLKYLSSFNPFFGSPSDVVNQKIRGEMFNALNPKSASQKQAVLGTLLSKTVPVLKGLGAAWKAGRGAGRQGAVKGVQALPAAGVSRLNEIKGAPISMLERALQKGVYTAAKSPFQTLGGAAGAAALPYFLKHTYDAGRQGVYDSAANNAMGMADLQMLSKFNQPGFMGGLGRAGMAIAPGIGSDMILNRVRQSMFPQYY
jgi:hypothetical protein